MRRRSCEAVFIYLYKKKICLCYSQPLLLSRNNLSENIIAYKYILNADKFFSIQLGMQLNGNLSENNRVVAINQY